jgi:hypothetical protein
MARDNRELLEILKNELAFIEAGGYGRSVRTPWLPTSVFQDSLSCLNFGDPKRTHPCNECILMHFVPADSQSTNVPCHHIPLSPDGETVDGLERWGTQDELEDTVKNWLRTTIKRLEEERASVTPAQPNA